MIYFKYKTSQENILICLLYLDASGNPITQIVQNIAVTDPSGNPVTGNNRMVLNLLIWSNRIITSIFTIYMTLEIL